MQLQIGSGAVQVQAAPVQVAQAQPAEAEKKPNEEGKKPEEGKPEGEKKEGDESSEVKRPTEPPRAPDPRELEVRPDEDGRVGFNFHGQPWPKILQWLANIGQYSLDWQELPSGYLNLTTTRRYSVQETRDLLNGRLLERGYTMVLQGEVLSVFKIEKLDPSLLPRVEDESLLVDLPAHDFVKMTFPLPDQLKADLAVNDVKPLLSAHAKVQPLMATNRLLVIDAVANLREVSRLLNSEHAAATQKIVPREFEIRFARASDVAD